MLDKDMEVFVLNISSLDYLIVDFASFGNVQWSIVFSLANDVNKG